MRIGVVVNASCDLPDAYIEAHGLVVVPGPIRFGDRTVLDRREPQETLDWYRRELTDRQLDARTVAPDIEQIRDLFLDDLVLRYDRVLMLCMSASRGRVFSRATEASYEILRSYRDRRAAAGITEPLPCASWIPATSGRERASSRRRRLPCSLGTRRLSKSCDARSRTAGGTSSAIWVPDDLTFCATGPSTRANVRSRH